MSTTEIQGPFASLPTQRRVGLRLHAFSNMISGNYYQRTEVPIGVSLSEWRVLQSAIDAPGTSQGEVAYTNGLNVMTVSRAVAGLRDKGLIETEADPEDRRRSLVHPTELGRAMGFDIAERANRMYEHVFSALSPAEIDQLDTLMERVNDLIRTTKLDDPPDMSRDWPTIIAERQAGETS